MSVLPGQLLPVIPGRKCEEHSYRDAEKRVVTEVDRFGFEDVHLCHECYKKLDEARKKRESELCHCEVCHHLRADCRNFRDPSEGQNGPVMKACADCRSRIISDFIGEDEDYESDEDRVQLVLGGSCHSALDDYGDYD